MATKPPPPRPAPRLYLATPLVSDAAQLATQLPALLGEADVAAVLLRLAPSDERGIIQRTKALAPPVQRAGAALLLDGHFEQVARGGADGANVSSVEAMQEAMPTLKPDDVVQSADQFKHPTEARAPPPSIPSPVSSTCSAANGSVRRTA